MSWETVIGLEVHAQLKTHTKLFSPASTQFGAPANTQTHFIDAAFPGTLPVLNRQAVHLAIQFGLAVHANIQNFSYFERKHYTYPDLPKGYQISQYRRPILSQGHIDISTPAGTTQRVIIEHAHLEEDAGKSVHDNTPFSAVDLNRAGIPLLEIVTTPCLHSATETVLYLKTLHQLLRFLDICDGNMQEGSFRCDVNLSLRKMGEIKLGTRTELKNLNSFRFIEKAIEVEVARHQDLLESGQAVTQQTRLYCPDTNTTHPMRDKEMVSDYRYFSDPDLLPIQISEQDIENARAELRETPMAIQDRLSQNDAFAADDIDFLLTTPHHIQFYDAVKKYTHAAPKTIINWLKGHYASLLNEQQASFANPPISAEKTAALLNRIQDQVISVKQAKDLFMKLTDQAADIDTLIQEAGYTRLTDEEALRTIILDILSKNPQQAAELRAGKEKLEAFFIGQIMKATKGQADPTQTKQLLTHLLMKN